jgi:glycosyltransferase involved in cell wall biosynthesis
VRVLHVSCDGLGIGGVQAVIMNICRNSANAKYDILLFTNEKRHYDDDFKQLGGKIFRIPKYEGNNKFRRRIDYYIRFFRIFFGTYKLIKKEGIYDAIHCHNDLESGICNLAAYFAGIKIRISHAHISNNLFPQNIVAHLYRKILQQLMNLTSNIKVGCTEQAFVNVFGENNLNKLGSYIVPNPIDLKKFNKTKRETKEKTVFNIVHVGRYDENKNQLFIIELLPYILKKVQNIKLKLIGHGDEYKKILISRIKELNILTYVDLLPSDTDIKEVLDSADVFILPSKSEGYGIVLIEAQAMEVPCLVSDTVPKIVDCGLCEFLALGESKQVWSNYVISLINGNNNLKLNREKLEKLDINNYNILIKSLYEGKYSR